MAASTPRETPPGIPLMDSAEAADRGWVAGFAEVVGVGSLEMLDLAYGFGESRPVGGHLNHLMWGLGIPSVHSKPVREGR